MKTNGLLSVLISACVAGVSIGSAAADDLAIASFGQNGALVFNTLNNGTNYTYDLEWAPSPGGPWRCFEGAAGLLQNLSPDHYGSVTSSVPMFYRVVARPPALRGMKRIPAGTNAGVDPDFGAYSLTVETFSMEATEVTKAKWDEVYAWAITNGYSFDNAGSGKAPGHPVQTVNWYDCVKWCNARSEKEGRTPVYHTSDAGGKQVYKQGQVLAPSVKLTANGYRLPSDVQWHYAARGGITGRRFPWPESHAIDHNRANYFSYWIAGEPAFTYDQAATSGNHPLYDDSEMPYTSPAGSFAPNGYGLRDMAGNVYEWCESWYPGESGTNRVYRGGAWYSDADASRAGHRRGLAPDSAFSDIGFRTVIVND